MRVRAAAVATRSARGLQTRFLSTRKSPNPSPRLPGTQKTLVCKAAQAGAPGEGPLPSSNNEVLEKGKSLLKSCKQAYLASLKKHPVATKAATSFIGFLCGDIIAQNLNAAAPFDIFRCLRLTLYGAMIDGPVGHYFYQFLDTRIRPDDPKGTEAVITKTAIDQLLWAPAMTVVFLAFLTTLEGHPEAIWSVVQAKLVPIYLANLGIWPLWHIINFRYVHPDQRILFNNLVAILWTTYLSWTCGAAGGHSGTPRDVLAAGLPCAAQAAAALLSSHHMADAIRQTSAVHDILQGWGPDGLPNADAGAELLVNYATMKAEVVRTVCGLPAGSSNLTS